MSDTFEKDHALGKHQEELIRIMSKLDKAIHKHPRALSFIALVRMLAVIMGPINAQTRKAMIDSVPITLRNILAEMDRMMANTHQ